MGQPTVEDIGYVFDNHNVHSREQHRCLAAAYDPMTLERLAETGVTTGWRCLEIGSGGGTVARWLAERVGPTGEVVATDVKPAHIAERPGLVVVEHDVVTDPLPDNAFDLIVARLVLQHVPERLAVLDKLVRALKPGGWLQIDEFDTSYEPPLLAPDARAEELYRTFLATKSAVMRAGGGDPEWGRRAPAAMRAAGLVDIDPRPRIQLRHAASAGLQLQLHHTYHLRDKLIAAGMTDQQLDDVRALMRDPSFRATSSIMYSIQGRRRQEDPSR
ncbi:class I SAM-dependent methyltransferase [Saccharopolyspora phatthalungensis]|uniref:Ubiquinone/menaquinone biosynthesis C-methylase UbiE n=1 Tax=Saccharopolyspora phatthalungensis TaxID=664693 RepID=A0A840QDD7_9PSEU|nr:class I SAM-dependent methyltransferase [Saccharopolyspora phatthalungensis]MBB5158784.1 ubiquinone/menaquinone biosynthesis C-methylase UbiE [Saccharopolyspora phatthalungensis]